MVADKTGFVMTEEFYNKVINDRKIFEEILEYFSAKIHISVYIRETMLLVRENSPNWLKIAVSTNLNKIIRKPKGVETVICAMLDALGSENPNDSTKSWKVIDIVSRIIIDSRKLPDFRENICKQVVKLLDIKSKLEEYLCPFERIFCYCTKQFSEIDKEICGEYFLNRLFKYINSLSNKEEHFSDNTNVTEQISQTIRLLHMCFCENQLKVPELSFSLLEKYSLILFHLYIILLEQKSFSTSCEMLRDILIKFIENYKEVEQKYLILDAFLFDITTSEIFRIRNDIEITFPDGFITIKLVNHRMFFPSMKSGKTLLNMFQNNLSLSSLFFTYLLNCLTQQDKYFHTPSKKDLLQLENQLVLDEAVERKMTVYDLLSSLSEHKDIQKQLNENPTDIISYIAAVLQKGIDSKLLQASKYESDEFQSFFVVMMLLQQLVLCASQKTLKSYKCLIESLEILLNKCNNEEVKGLIVEILTVIKNDNFIKNTNEGKKELTEFEKALEDICDPLLPVRGHGLMALAKLVEKKDKNAMQKKQYLLNIFQQNLKQEDSFIYLSAIGGLAAMGDVFPDTILNILCEEYLNFERKDKDGGHEIQMKIGEVLVRIIKILGEMAPKYKSLLLNTFLQGTKHDDHLVRTSSLSNLGEICRVLGYKLGTIVTEVLVCVHAIIATDKTPEARRAAVSVLRQLFMGLQKEMIVFLKDEILPIYRTLKNIYHNDPDDVMRLQAQLALEELNENMREFVFPNPQLHFDKKVIMLN